MIDKMLCRIICILCMFGLICSSAYAESIVPYADSEFDSAYINLLTNKTASIYAYTYTIKAQISVDSIWLEQKLNGAWVYSRALPKPTKIAQNTFAYFTNSDFSSFIGTGTYRIGCVYNADGHTITRYSNEQTY